MAIYHITIFCVLKYDVPYNYVLTIGIHFIKL
jgi:hypothetical protein